MTGTETLARIMTTASLAVGLALSLSQPARAQVIPLEMTVTAPHRLVVAGAGDSGFQYDGRQLTPATDRKVFCLESSSSDIVLQLATQNETRGGFNSLEAEGISTHISYESAGVFSPATEQIELTHAASIQFDLSASGKGAEGCLPDQYAFLLDIAPVMTTRDGAVSVQQAVTQAGLVGEGAKVFSDIITLTFSLDLGTTP